MATFDNVTPHLAHTVGGLTLLKNLNFCPFDYHDLCIPNDCLQCSVSVHVAGVHYFLVTYQYLVKKL